ncbi:MAG: glycosyltransferase family 4 protein [Elusimicrobiales bacterium]|nr:glycosyltransferase family 4 protein [Elusimicrobiales bacterium]
MNLLFVSESSGWSGGTNQMLLTARGLSEKGHRIVFILPEGGVTAERVRAAGFDCRPLRIRQDYDIPAALKIKKIAAETNAAVVHAHHPQAHAVCLIAKYLGMSAPLVVTRRVIFRIRTNPFSAIKYRSKKIARYVAVCNAARTELAKGGVAPERIDVIPSAVEMSRYEDARARRAALAMKPPFRVGLIGHYAWFKGHDYLLEAARDILKEFPGTVFVFAGRDTDKLKAVAEKYGVAKNVEILGERGDVSDILAGLHIFAMPSLQEGIATALIEAQSAGVPAVATNIGGIPDVMLDGETGLMVPARDAAALSAAILKYFKNPALAGQMAERGYNRVLANFNLSSVCDRLERMYCEISGVKL